MNRTEEAFERYLGLEFQARAVAWYRFEPARIRLAPRLYYVPDFGAIRRPDRELWLYDVKGTRKRRARPGRPGGDEAFVEEDALVKIKAAAALWWFARFAIARPTDRSLETWSIEEIPPV